MEGNGPMGFSKKLSCICFPQLALSMLILKTIFVAISDFKEYFEVEFDASSSTVGLTVTDPLPNTESIIILTLSVSTDNTASTSLIIYLPTKDNTLQFNNHYYTGNYNDVTNQVEHDTITITSATTPDVTISGGE